LAEAERAPAGKRRGSEVSVLPQNFKQLLGDLDLTKPVALEAQRIGKLPDAELEKALARCHKDGDLCAPGPEDFCRRLAWRAIIGFLKNPIFCLAVRPSPAALPCAALPSVSNLWGISHGD